jgi:Dockerin type I domain
MRCIRCLRRSRLVFCLIAIFGMGLTSTSMLHAQTTRTWAAAGPNSQIGNGANWVGGVAPNFAGDSTTDSATFSASSNTSVQLRNVTTGDPFNAVTFDASAPAYTFGLPPGNTTNDLVILPGGNLTNNSANTQTFTGLPDVTLNAIPTVGVTLAATNGNAGTKLSFDLKQLTYNNTDTSVTPIAVVDLSKGFNVRTQTLNGVGTSNLVVNDNNQVANSGGTLFITGDSGANPNNLTISGGAVRISNSGALGGSGSLTILGSTTNDGRLELVGGINSNKAIVINGRSDGTGAGAPANNGLNPAIVNVSGNNTLSGPISTGPGGGAYSFASTSGTLTLASNVVQSRTSDRAFVFEGAGNITVNGNLQGNPALTSNTIMKIGTGTVTFNGNANEKLAMMDIQQGTLAFGSTFGATYAQTDASIGTTNFHMQTVITNGGTLDVSAIPGGYTMPNSLAGNGTMTGTVTMAANTQVLPGDTLGTQQVLYFPTTPSIGNLTVHGSIDLSAGSQMVWDLGALSTSNPGTDFDLLSVSGNLKLGGASTLALNFSPLSGDQQPDFGDPFWNSNHSWKIVSSGSNTGNTNFASLSNNTFDSGTFSTSVIAGGLSPGDANSDGIVNGLDINLVAGHWLHTGANTPGDVNGDGIVNGLDINVVAGHWLNTGTPGGILLTYTAAAQGVPEPSTLVLGLLAALGLAYRSRQRRK